VPESDGRRNLLIVAGAHIGYHEGQWGRVPRKGQSEVPTTSCGSLSGIVEAGYEALRDKAADPLDRQQQIVGQIMLPYLKSCADAGRSPDIIDATLYLMQQIDNDLTSIVDGAQTQFAGQIALITGITINTVEGNYFSPSQFEVFGSR
jgi:hypothetical protein